MKMITNSATDIIERLIEGGLEEKYARIILALCGQAPMKASEIGKLVSISRMDAYNSLKKLKEMGLVMATLDKPMSCLLYTSPSPRDATLSRMPSSA